MYPLFMPVRINLIYKWAKLTIVMSLLHNMQHEQYIVSLSVRSASQSNCKVSCGLGLFSVQVTDCLIAWIICWEQSVPE